MTTEDDMVPSEHRFKIVRGMLDDLDWKTAHAVNELIGICANQQRQIDQQGKDIEGLWKRINDMNNE